MLSGIAGCELGHMTSGFRVLDAVSQYRSAVMFNLVFRSSPRPAERDAAHPPRPERRLPSVFVRKLECDLAHHDKIARVLTGRRQGLI